jgi:PEP-CTERM/exosortase A-associated glycosyltransferase
MHILHVFDHSIPLHSGYTFRSRAILREQRKLGWTTAHVTSPKHNQARPAQAGEAPAYEEIDGLGFYRCEPVPRRLGELPVLNQLFVMKDLEQRLEEVIAREKPDLIQVHSPALNAIPAIRAGHRAGIPVVYEIRAFWEDAAVSHGTSAEGGLRYRLTRALETRAVRQADGVTCICHGIRNDLVARGIRGDKITIIPNAVDIENFEPIVARDAQLAAELGLDDKPVVGFIGSFYAYEGLDLLLDAIPLVLDRLPDLQVLLVGGGPVEQQIREQVQRLGIGGRVHFTGRVPHDQVSRYYSLVDVQVYARHPLRITELVTPLKPLEAMAQKSLFLASDVGGHKELIRDGENGVLFRAGDVHDLAEQLHGMFTRRERWDALREAGRHYVESERNWANSIANYRPLYERLVGSRSKA